MPLDLLHPPPYRYRGPIIDAHCHLTNLTATERMIRAGGIYGVTRWIGICKIDEVAAMRRRFGRQLGFSIWTEHHAFGSPAEFIEVNRRIVEQAAELDCHCIKFWYKPEFNRRSGLFFDDPRLDPIFAAMIEAGLPALVHIADPDLWWRHHYSNSDWFESKTFTYRQLTNTLNRFPEMRVQVAHFGGHPEDLEFLDHLLARHPNCYLDTSATKWIARELSLQAPAARAFMIRWADRLLFGSDLVPFKRVDVAHHCSRYYVHRHLYEQSQVIPSPIEDPDAGGPVYAAGLALPDETLQKIYYHNAAAFFNIS